MAYGGTHLQSATTGQTHRPLVLRWQHVGMHLLPAAAAAALANSAE
jgi:hypothetical protein